MLSLNEAKAISPFVVGIPDAELDAETEQVLKDLNPAGVILFGRNCKSASQMKDLTAHLAQLSPLAQPLIFIDQEGGRVERVKWGYRAPTSQAIGNVYQADQAKGLQAAQYNGYLIGGLLSNLGVTVNCAPVADVFRATAHELIGDRSFSANPHDVAALCAATISGMLASGVWGVIKHAPGHGAAMVDSHEALPVVNTPLTELEELDFLPFKLNAKAPFVMTAHVVYETLDKLNCATQSPTVLNDVLRHQLGMDGLIVADDINMKALTGETVDKSAKALQAGCDLVLQCSGHIDGTASKEHFDQMKELTGKFELSTAAQQRLEKLPALGKAKDNLLLEAEQFMKEVLSS